MSANFTSALKAEIAELESEIRKNPDPRLRKLLRLREALAEYEPSTNVLQAADLKIGGTLSVVANATIRTKEEKIRAELTHIFRERGPTHRSKLLEHLIHKGLMGTEKDPMASLAAYLSDWKDIFDFDGKGNWSLRKGVFIGDQVS